MATLSAGAAAWWRDLLREVMGSYTTWLESSPIVLLTLHQKILADVPPLDRFQRVEQRAAMLLLECLPEDLRAEAISTRATSVKGMLFLTFCCYQEGREAQLAAVPDHPRGSLQFGFRGHLSKEVDSFVSPCTDRVQFSPFYSREQSAVPSWDGSARSWRRYTREVAWFVQSTPTHKRRYCASKLLSRLGGPVGPN